MKVGDTVEFKTKGDTRLKEGEIIGDPWRVWFPDGLWTYAWDDVTEIKVLEPPYEPQNGDVIRESKEDYVRYNDIWWKRVVLTDAAVKEFVGNGKAQVISHASR